MKKSTFLLGAWFVVVAGLVFAVGVIVWRTSPKPSGPGAVHEIPSAKKGAKEPGTGIKRYGERGEKSPPPATARQLEVTGVVRGPDDAPVAGARVSLHETAKQAPPPETARMEEIQLVNQLIYLAPEDWDKPRPMSMWAEGGAAAPLARAGVEYAAVETGSDGTFKLGIPSNIGRGPFRVAASREGVGAATAQGVIAGQRLELKLGTAGQVEGLVLAEVGSVPVPGARVVFDNGERQFAAATDDAGEFKIDGVTPGYYQVTVGAKGQTPLIESRVAVARGEKVTLKLPRGTTLRVKCEVFGEGGDPRNPDMKAVEGATVVVMNTDTYGYEIGKSNALGIAEFPGLTAGRYSVNAQAPGLVSLSEENVVVDRNQLVQEAAVEFEPAVETQLTVVDEDGRPVPGVEFYTANSEEEYDALRSLKLPGASDAEGQYRFAFEFEGPRAMVFGFKKGHALVRAYPDEYDAGDPIRLVMRRAVSVRGKVTTEDGTPVPDAAVIVEIGAAADDEEADLEDVTLQLRTDKDGNYAFPHLPRAGDISIYAETEDGWTDYVDLEVVAGKTEYDLNLTLETTAPPTPPK